MLTDGAFSFVPARRRGGRTQVLALFRYRLLRNAARLFLHAILPCRTSTRSAMSHTLSSRELTSSFIRGLPSCCAGVADFAGVCRDLPREEVYLVDWRW